MKFLPKLIAGATLSLLCACSLSSTHMLQTWTNPQQGTAPIHFNKILVVAVAPSDAERRTAEDAMAAKIGPKATPSYTLLSADELKDKETAKQQIKGSLVDGVIVVRWVGYREEKEVVGTPLYSTAWDHTSSYSMSYNQESPVAQWKILQLETRIFSATEEKLIWSGTTETVEPHAISKLIDELAVIVRKELRKHGLLLSTTNKPTEIK